MFRESLLLYLFRLSIACFILGFMAMIYWSSLLVEENMQTIKGEINSLKTQVNDLKSRERNPEPETKASKNELKLKKKSLRPHIDPKYPNLLQEDPFFAKTLPNILGPGFTPQGTRHQSVIGKANNLHPFSEWYVVMEWISYCTASLAQNKTGIFETFSPSAAIKIEGRPVEGSESPEYWIHLREGMFWHPLNPSWFPSDIKLAPHFLKKHPVTSHDFKLYYDAVMNPFITESLAVTLRVEYADIEEFRIIDDLTFVVRWKSFPVIGEDGRIHILNKYRAKNLTLNFAPLASFVYKYFPDGKKIVEEDASPDTYRNNSIWAQNFSFHWAKNIIPSFGPWLFDGLTERVARFKRNPDYFNPWEVLADALEIQVKESGDSAWQEFKSGGLDFLLLQPEQTAELQDFLASAAYKEQEKKGLGIRQLDYVSRSFSYIAWNEANPLFSSKKIRQALAYAIDRKRIINQIMSGRAIEITGTFFRYSPNYDDSILPIPYDPEKARRLLEEEGWFDIGGDGIIKKEIDGKITPFDFSLTYYAKNQTTRSIVEYVVTALKEVGIRVNPKGVDVADLSAMFEDKNFDAYTLAWSLSDPPEDPRQVWSSQGAKEKGSSNSIGFANPEIDKIIDELTYQYDPIKRVELYHRFDKILYDEMPYAFLFTSKVVFLYREYLQNVFLPIDRQDLIPGANKAEPVTSLFWIKK